MPVQVGADDTDTITGVNNISAILSGDPSGLVDVLELVPLEPVVATDRTRRCITRVSYFEPHAVVGPRIVVSDLGHSPGATVVLVERHDFHPVTDRELRHAPSLSACAYPRRRDRPRSPVRCCARHPHGDATTPGRGERARSDGMAATRSDTDGARCGVRRRSCTDNAERHRICPSGSPPCLVMGGSRPDRERSVIFRTMGGSIRSDDTRRVGPIREHRA